MTTDQPITNSDQTDERTHAFAVTFDANGLVPVVAQEMATGDVLLLAYMNAEALERTLDEGILVLWSRSRAALWRKGETSGQVLRVRELRVNCEGNSLLARVELAGLGACHEGYRSCYFRRLARAEDGALTATVTETRVFDPAQVYGAASPAAGTPTADASASDEASETSLERDARALYAAYERLRDDDLTATSATSRLLHAPDRAATSAHALTRAAQELEELRGALAGTHRHHGDERDILLEAGQVGYWASLAAIAAGQPYDAWQPHRVWLAGWRGLVAALPQSPPDATLRACASLLIEAGALCQAARVHPARVVASDLAAMRSRHA